MRPGTRHLPGATLLLCLLLASGPARAQDEPSSAAEAYTGDVVGGESDVPNAQVLERGAVVDDACPTGGCPSAAVPGDGVGADACPPGVLPGTLGPSGLHQGRLQQHLQNCVAGCGASLHPSGKRCSWYKPFTETSQPDLFYNFYVPNTRGAAGAAYPAPYPTPSLVGHTYYTYQPLMPHEFLYQHHRTYHQYYNQGMGLNRTSVQWYGTPVRTTAEGIRHFFTLPR